MRIIMRLNVEIGHKIGLPNYGSSTSTVGITLDVPEDLADALANDPKKLRAQLVALQALARGLVEHDLALIDSNARDAAAENPQPTVSSRPAPRPARRFTPETDEDGWPAPVGQRPTTSQDPGFDPQSGRQLYPWAKKQEEAGIPGVLKRLTAFGKGEGYPARMVEWNGEQTHAALRSIRQPKAFSRN
jgi:hypothetical protein